MLSCQLFVKSSNQQKFDFDYNFKLKLVKLKVMSQAAFCHFLPRASRPANLTDIPLHSLSWYHTLKISNITQFNITSRCDDIWHIGKSADVSTL